MKRRNFIKTSLVTSLTAAVGSAHGTRLMAAADSKRIEAAAKVLADATTSKQVEAAALYVRSGKDEFARGFGKADSKDSIFLLASISKTISIAAVMTLYDKGLFDLEDPVQKHIAEFKGDGREKITMRQLLTHVSGLPDQLPQNAKLRARHAPLSQFVNGAIHTPLLFAPGSQYSYSSMAILLATDVARRLTGKPIAQLVDEAVVRPLGMKHSALGVGRFKLESLMRCQVENAAPESGSGDPTTKDWDWNSVYWRELGVPWGGAHGSAPDVAKFLEAFLHPGGKLLKPETARLMIRNHNPKGIRPRGLAFDLGDGLGGPQDSDSVFGHSGSTGTLCWADPESDSVCVILTTLPARAVKPHPRDVTTQRVAKAIR